MCDTSNLLFFLFAEERRAFLKWLWGLVSFRTDKQSLKWTWSQSHDLKFWQI